MSGIDYITFLNSKMPYNDVQAKPLGGTLSRIKNKLNWKKKDNTPITEAPVDSLVNTFLGLA